MVYIITKSRTSKGVSDFHMKSNDELHNKRKQLAREMKDGMFSKDQMNMTDCKDSDAEDKRVQDYDNWKDTKVKGQTNNEKMKEWSNINREMKARGNEGDIHTVDQIREGKKINYD